MPSEYNIEYVTRSEMMSKLRESMSGYMRGMQSQMQSDMRVISELNARAVSTDDPAKAAMLMTVASELAQSIDARLELEVNAVLAKALGEPETLYVDDQRIYAVPEIVGGPDNGNNNVISVNDWEKGMTGNEYKPKSSGKYYALKNENGEPIDGMREFEKMKNDLLSKLRSANKKFASADKSFLSKMSSEQREYDKLTNSEDYIEGDDETEKKLSWEVRKQMKNVAENYTENSDKTEYFSGAVLNRCSNIRNIARSMLEGGTIWYNRYGFVDESDFNYYGKELPYNAFISEDEERSESSLETMAYLTEKARNAIDLAADGASEDKSYSRLDKSQLNILKTKLDADDEHTSVYYKNDLEKNFDSISKSSKITAEKTVSPFEKENAAIGMCIFSDKGENINVTSFIEKVRNGEELTDEERGWACRQFDIMAKNSGADIRGMYVNGEPVFKAEYYDDPQAYEEEAKCEVIAAALDGMRISAVPVKDRMPVADSKPVPVAVIDMVETTLTLWEKILRFFGFGRENRIREANKNNAELRAADAENIANDIESNSDERAKNDKINSARIMAAEKLKSIKPDPVFEAENDVQPEKEENAAVEEQDSVQRESEPEQSMDPNLYKGARRIEILAKNVIKNRTEILARNNMEFFGGLYPDVDGTASIEKINDKIANDIAYTSEKGDKRYFLATFANRYTSRTNFVMLYGMTKGYTLDEMIDGKNVDRAAIGKEFMEKFSIKQLDKFAKENNLDAASPETRKTYNEYVLGKKQDIIKLSTDMYEALKRQEFKVPDPNDPEKFIEDYSKNKFYFGMVGDFVQVFAGLCRNDLNPSDPAAKAEVDRSEAINNYEYYKFMSVQAYSACFDKYMDYLSDQTNMIENDEVGIQLDMAARSKALLESSRDWFKDKKTWGDIVDDHDLSDRLGLISSMCLGEDENFDETAMNQLDYEYLRSTDKNFDYIKIDPEHYAINRLGFSTSNEERIGDNKKVLDNAEKEAGKYLPEGFTKDLSKAFESVREQEAKAKEAPIREKIDFNELVGESPKRVEMPSSSTGIQREKEKSMDSRSLS